MSGNLVLEAAKKQKDDEFFTQREDIENELRHYKDHFKDKIVYMNCDDPAESEFWKFFVRNFEPWDIKKLIATHYIPDNKEQSYKIEIVRPETGYYKGKHNSKVNIPQEQMSLWLDPVHVPIESNGDFESEACVKILKEADIVVTNPPFSKFRSYVKQLMDYQKKFVIIGNQNAISYKEIFPLIQENKMWLGYHNGDMSFKVPDYYPERSTRFWIDETGQKWRSLGNICWFTNLDIPKRHQPLDLRGVKYEGNEENYPYYDEYPAINIDKVSEIPEDYYGVMGVPLTFFTKYSPDQFEIVGLDRYVDNNPHPGRRFKIDGKEKYARILIRRKDGPDANRRTQNQDT